MGVLNFMKTKKPYIVLLWIARFSGTFMVAFTLFFVIGSLMEESHTNTGSSSESFSPLMIIIFIIWGIALAGLILAIWKAGLGGVISLVCFILMYILNLFNTQASIRAGALPVFLFFSIPSILYLCYWKLIRDTKLMKDNTETMDQGQK
jgi:hypothetical protein